MGKIRTFLSLNISSEDIDFLAKVQLAYKDFFYKHKIIKENDIKWELPEKFHLTLKFLGSVDKDKLESLIKVLDSLKFNFEKIEFITKGIGFFPNNKFPNVIYMELIEQNENIKELVEFIEKVIYKFYIKTEKRFIPHITLGRFRRNSKVKLIGIEEKLKKDITVKNRKIEFESFYLMESILTSNGSIYKSIHKFNFTK